MVRRPEFAIGPETSRIVSEIIMSSVDAAFLDDRPWVKRCTVRYIDDVTAYTSNQLQSFEFVSTYLDHLAQYELTLNAHKTKYLSYVEPPDPVWRVEIVRLVRGVSVAKRSESMISALAAVLNTTHAAGTSTPMRYFLTSMPRASLNASNWDFFQDFLMIGIRMDGILLAHAHQYLVWAKRKGFVRNFRELEANLYDYMRSQGKLGNAFEVASTINILADIGTVVETTSAEEAAVLESDLVDLLLLEASAKVGRLRNVRDLIVSRACADDAFISGHWLAAYEVQRRDSRCRTPDFKAGEWENLASKCRRHVYT